MFSDVFLIVPFMR